MLDNPCTTRLLQAGDTGPCVRYLQELLRMRHAFTGAVDGVMGEGTSRALKHFQQQNGLDPTGKTEPVTWELLVAVGIPSTPPPRQRCRLLRIGAEGPDVGVLQERLERLGFTPGLVDGVYGPSTENAVKEWQRSVGLPANGVIGRRAWGMLGIDCSELVPCEQRELTPPLTIGDQGRAVILLQALLLSAGFDPGPIDGAYGSLTAAAVGALQRAAGIPSNPTVDQRVWAILGMPFEDGLDQCNPYPRLRYGSRGARVKELQVLLLEMGFELGELDGVYGHAVKEAVLQLQRAMNLPLTGKVGWEEWQALGISAARRDHLDEQFDKILCSGDRGPEVERLQRLLHEIGYDPGHVDGIYGPLTEAAIMLLQRSEGLPVTGIVDEPTWSALC